MTIMQDLIKAGIKKKDMDSHESDLYVRKNEISTPIIERYKKIHPMVSTFISQIDGKRWYDIPFANDNFWANKVKNKMPKIPNPLCLPDPLGITDKR
jgi:hypothetical protein